VLLVLACVSGALAGTIAAGSNFTAAITSNSTLYTWGGDGSGQLGNSSNTGINTPTQVGINTWNTVAAGSSFTAAIATDGSLWTWGANGSGQLGSGTTGSTDSPGPIASGTTWTSVAAGSDFTLAITSAGTLWAWGDNSSGQLGNGNNSSTNSPGGIAIGTSNWTSVTAGTAFTVALQSNGTLWTWGANGSGQLGNGNNTNTNSPGQIANGNLWTAVTAGSDFALARRSDGTLWAWGDNSIGQLGIGNTTTTTSSTPLQAGAGITWMAVAAGLDFVLAIAQDGSMWGWGDNSSGQLGNGTTTSSASPVQVSGGNTWAAVAAGSNFAVAVATDGSLWAWGDNSSGQLGDGGNTTQYVPEEIATSGFSVRPTVIFTVPPNGATNVEVDSRISATFNLDMDPSSLTPATFTFSPPVAGSVTYDPTTDTATFIPSNNLSYYTNYTVTITTGARNASGDNMAAAYTWTFQTEQPHKHWCFIATAAYGSYLDPHVSALRTFRDNHLLTNGPGRSFVALYYRYSPPLARLIADRPALRAATRWMLAPIVYGVTHPGRACLFLSLCLAFICIGGMRRRPGRAAARRKR
jgi:alpha-tubulin suppressor-like RCC1 family protein